MRQRGTGGPQLPTRSCARPGITAAVQSLPRQSSGSLAQCCRENAPSGHLPNDARGAVPAFRASGSPRRLPLTKLVLVGALPPPISGQSLAFQSLVEGLNERTVDFGFIDLSDRGPARGGAPTFSRAFQYLRVLRNYVQMVHRCTGTVYLQIAQSRFGFLRDALFILIAGLRRLRIVCHLHGGNYDRFYRQQPRFLRALIRTALRRADRVIVLGEGLRSLFDFEPSLGSKITVVPNGLPYAPPSSIRPKRIPSDPNEPIRILYMSNLIESKGYFDVLKAVHLLATRDGLTIDAKFCGAFWANRSDDVCVRSADHAESLFRRFVDQHGLANCVHYCGVLSGAEKERALTDAHFLVLPSYYDNEGQPLAIIEAMAHGCVSISTDHRAIGDLIVDGESGLLVPPREPCEIATRIAALVGDPERYEQMSEAALQRFGKFFTREAHLERMLAALTRDPQCSSAGAPAG